MRQSFLFTKTRREAPKDETAKNAQLLIRAGFVHKEMAGVYSYLPLGLRVLAKINQIIREEMNAIGGQEIQMSLIQDKQLYEKTDRWDDAKVDNWFKSQIKNGSEVGLALTNEEPITNIVSEHVQSYKDLPKVVYQIGTKLRNEARAKSGVMRGREFMMKDMYSFHTSDEDFKNYYEKAALAYKKVFDRLGIGEKTYRTVADGGIFTKEFSHEFQTLSEMGEDTIYVDESSHSAVNKEVYSDETLTKLGLDKSKLVEKKGIETGNIFPLGDKYTKALGLSYKDEQGEVRYPVMGCYGIGVSRVMGAIVEVTADDKGIVWPEAVAPFKIHLLALDDEGRKVADEWYKGKEEEVLYDDRDTGAGEKFADADLIGIPTRLVASKKSLAAGGFESRDRKTGLVKLIPAT